MKHKIKHQLNLSSKHSSPRMDGESMLFSQAKKRGFIREDDNIANDCFTAKFFNREWNIFVFPHTH